MDKEREFYENINVDKAKRPILMVILISFLNLSTYAEPFFIYGESDFGFIFEFLGFVFMLAAFFFALKRNIQYAKTSIIISFLALEWIVVYDVLTLIRSDFEYFNWICEISMVFELILSYKAYIYLSIIDNPIKRKQYEKTTDWFYEVYDENVEVKDNENEDE